MASYFLWTAGGDLERVEIGSNLLNSGKETSKVIGKGYNGNANGKWNSQESFSDYVPPNGPILGLPSLAHANYSCSAACESKNGTFTGNWNMLSGRCECYGFSRMENGTVDLSQSIGEPANVKNAKECESLCAQNPQCMSYMLMDAGGENESPICYQSYATSVSPNIYESDQTRTAGLRNDLFMVSGVKN